MLMPNLPDNKHVDTKDLEAALDAGDNAARPSEDLGRIRQHLAACEACRLRMEQYRGFKAKLARLRVQGHAKRGRACPSASAWFELVGGLVSSSRAGALLEHASSCDYCGELLRTATEDLAAEITSEEEVMAGLESSSSEWQNALVAKLTRTQPFWRRWLKIFGTPWEAIRNRRYWGFPLAYVSAAIAAIILAVFGTGSLIHFSAQSRKTL